jgi:hypothetical protein
VVIVCSVLCATLVYLGDQLKTVVGPNDPLCNVLVSLATYSLVVLVTSESYRVFKAIHSVRWLRKETPNEFTPLTPPCA